MCVRACVRVSPRLGVSLPNSGNNKDSSSTVPHCSNRCDTLCVSVWKLYVSVYVWLSPGHRCWRGIPTRGYLINVKVTGREEGSSGGREEERGMGSDEEDACLVLCLSLPVPWWNAESHERGPLSLCLSLRLVSCVCLKSTTVPGLTHYLSADFAKASVRPQNQAEANQQNHKYRDTHTHTHLQLWHSHHVYELWVP